MASPRWAVAFMALNTAWHARQTSACDTYTLDMYDTYGDGWNGNHYQLYSLSTQSYHAGTLGSGSSGSRDFCLDDDCWVFVVDGGNWDEEVSWEFYGDTEGVVNGTAPTVKHFCTDGGSVSSSGERPKYNVTFTINHGFTNDGDGWFGDEADCYVKVKLDDEVLETSIQYDDRTPLWEEDLTFHGCVADDESYRMHMYDSDTLTSDDLVLGPWYTTLAYLMGANVNNDYDPVTWMLYDGDLDYVVFTVSLEQCAGSVYSPNSPSPAPTLGPTPGPTHTWGPSLAPTTPSPTTLTATPTTPSPTSAFPTVDPTSPGDSLTLLYPRSSTTWRTGQFVNITYEMTGLVGPVSLFLFNDGEYVEKISFLLHFNVTTACDEEQLKDGSEDDDCDPVTEHEHNGATDDVYYYTVPHGLETGSSYQIEAFSATGQFAMSDEFTIIATPTPAPTGDSTSDDEGLPLFVLGAVTMAAVSCLLVVMYLCYRRWKSRGRPSSWLYDTHIAMDDGAHESRPSALGGVEMGPVGRATVILNGDPSEVEAEVVSFATAVPVSHPDSRPLGKSDPLARAPRPSGAAAVEVEGEVLGVVPLEEEDVVSALHQGGPSAML